MVIMGQLPMPHLRCTCYNGKAVRSNHVIMYTVDGATTVQQLRKRQKHIVCVSLMPSVAMNFISIQTKVWELNTGY